MNRCEHCFCKSIKVDNQPHEKCCMCRTQRLTNQVRWDRSGVPYDTISTAPSASGIELWMIK